MKKSKTNDKKYKFTAYGEKFTIILAIGNYASNGTLAVEMICVDSKGVEEPFASLTVNIADSDKYANNKDLAFVDTNNLGMSIMQWLIDNDIAEETDIVGFSGYCMYSLMKFKNEALVSMRSM